LNPLWQQIADRASLVLTPLQLDRLAQYLDLLLAANETMNLTRIDTREAAEVGHVADALTLLEYLPRNPHYLADVGSGGGVPGIVLAIVRDDVKVTLIESTQKKATFLQQTANSIQLKNLTVVPRRAEDFAKFDARETFDVVTARAVGAMDKLAEWCMPLLKARGKLLAMKGEKIISELPVARPVIQRLGGAEPVIHPVTLPGTTHHVIVEIVKMRSFKPKLRR
jgi:16S rRNA (guanine527-N7)-methyltransferase